MINKSKKRFQVEFFGPILRKKVHYKIINMLGDEFNIDAQQISFYSGFYCESNIKSCTNKKNAICQFSYKDYIFCIYIKKNIVNVSAKSNNSKILMTPWNAKMEFKSLRRFSDIDLLRLKTLIKVKGRRGVESIKLSI